MAGGSGGGHHNETVGQQRVTVKSPPIECLPRKKARRIESSSTHSSPAGEFATSHNFCLKTIGLSFYVGILGAL